MSIMGFDRRRRVVRRFTGLLRAARRRAGAVFRVVRFRAAILLVLFFVGFIAIVLMCAHGCRGNDRRPRGGSTRPAFMSTRSKLLGRAPPGIANTPALVKRSSTVKPPLPVGAPARSPAFATVGFDRTRFIALSAAFFAAASVVCAFHRKSIRSPNLPWV